MGNISIKMVSWADCKNQMAAIRRKVFIVEQHVPEELEWDEFDSTANHILAFNSENLPIATGRIKKDGHIGRMAVLKKYRQKGVGSTVLLGLIDIAKQQNLDGIFLHAQVEAVPFYLKHGFNCEGDEFLDAGIAHKSMYKKLL